MDICVILFLLFRLPSAFRTIMFCLGRCRDIAMSLCLMDILEQLLVRVDRMGAIVWLRDHTDPAELITPNAQPLMNVPD